MTIPIGGLNHITFSVSDLNRSVAFYRNVFGTLPLFLDERTAYFDIGGMWLALNVQADIPRQEVKQSYTHLAFTIDAADIGLMEQRLEHLGVEQRLGRVRSKGEGRSLYFADPDGHLLEFHTGDLASRLQAYHDAKADTTSSSKD